MFKTKHYVPVLKWKLGEYMALNELQPELRNKLTPVIEIPPIQFDFTTEEPAKKIDQHLEKVTQQIRESWGIKNHFFLDLLRIQPDERMENEEHPLAFLANDARQKKLKMIPITELDKDGEYQAQIKEINLQDKNGICLRIYKDDFGDANLEDRLNGFMKFLGINYENIDLILDLEYISSEYEKMIMDFLPANINSIPNLNNWRTFTFVATSFPEYLTNIAPNSMSTIRRSEWHIWNYLLESTINRKPSFGDYVIAYPEITEIDPRIIKASANIRYTTDNDWLIFKGSNLKREGYDQFHDLSHTLVNHRNYSGEEFSSGDLFIKKCANREVTPGNLTTWRRVGTNHHLTFVANQITSLAISDEN